MTQYQFVDILNIEEVTEHSVDNYTFWSGHVRFPSRQQPLQVLIFLQNGFYAAISAYCPHEGYSLHNCRLQADGTLHCPVHGQRIIVFGENSMAWLVQRTETGFLLLPKNQNNSYWLQQALKTMTPTMSTETALLQEELTSLRHAYHIQEQQILKITANMDAMLRAVETQRNELKIAHKQEQNLNAFINRVTDSIDEVMIVVDPHGIIKQVNQKAKLTFEDMQTSLIGGSIDSLLPPAQQTYLKQQLKKPLVAGQSLLMTLLHAEGTYYQEHTLATADATEKHHIYLVRVTLLYNPQGKLEGAVLLATDIHALKLREQALQQSEEKFRLTTEAAQEAIILIDEQDHVYFWNNAAEKIFGYSVEEIQGQELHEVIVPERYRPAFRAGFKHFRQTGTGPAIHCTRELEALRRDGSEFPIELALAAVKIEEHWHAIGMVRDITTRKQAEAELKAAKAQADIANQAKSDFLANMSHEIRTPMNAIMGMTELALGTELTAQQRNYLEKALLSAKNLLSIINDILDLSKIEAQRMELEQIRFDLSEVIDNFNNVIGLKASEKGLDFLINIANDVPLQIEGDPLRLGQILINLGSNAIKFTKQGSIVLTIVVLQHDADTVRLQFSLRDNGIGLNPTQLSRLFQAFSQADTSTTRRYGGTGLGLVICQHLVRLMGGEITVESTPGIGSVFSFTIQCRMVGSETLASRLVPSKLHDKHVLVVDDNELARETLSLMLTQFGLQVTTAENGKQALQKIVSTPPTYWDLLILDWHMPELDGLTLAKRVAEHYHIQNLPCPMRLMITAYGREDLIQQASQIVDAVLIKPITSTLLLETTLRLLDCNTVVVHPEVKSTAITSYTELGLADLPVLLVEDNEINQEIALEHLTRTGCQVTLAADGAIAVQAVQNQRFALILMDVQMPVMDGYEATRQIRTLAHGQTVPIIAMTANAMQQDRTAALAAGMDDYISKPVDYTELLLKLQHWGKTKSMPSAIEIPAPEIPAPPTPTPTPSVTAETKPTQLPEQLPGLDITRGLQQLCGNEALYLRCLNHFVQQYRTVAQQLRQYLTDQAYTEADNLLHTFKGVTGNLSATPLFHLTEELRQHLHADPAQMPEPLLQRFDHECQVMLDSIAQLQTFTQTDTERTALTPKEQQQIKQHLTRIARALTNSEYIGTQQLQPLLTLGRKSAQHEQFTQLEHHIIHYEHKQALAVLKQLQQTLER